MLSLFLAVLSVAEVSILAASESTDWFRIHSSKFVNRSISPCDNFFRHVCPTSMISSETIHGEAENLFSFWMTESLKTNRYTDKTRFLDTVLSLEFLFDSAELKMVSDDLRFIVNLFKRHSLYSYLDGRVANLSRFKKLKMELLQRVGGGPEVHIPFLDDNLQVYKAILDNLLRIYTSIMTKNRLAYYVPHTVRSKLVEFRQVVKMVVSSVIDTVPENIQRSIRGTNVVGGAQLLKKSVVVNEKILAPFFYNVNDASLYGALGYVIAHELAHYYPNGQPNQSFKDCVTRRTTASCRKYAESSCESGSRTFEEDQADLKGLRTALTLFESSFVNKSPPIADLQFVFYSYAIFWCDSYWAVQHQRNIYNDYDTHSANFVRVNWPLATMKEFTTAFNCRMETDDVCTL